jgi:hypothetical protein
MTHPPSRRQFLETAAPGMALGMGMMTVSGGAAVAATAAQPGRRPRMTALTSVYYYLSHASHIVGRFLDGFVVYPEDTAATTFFGEPHKPPFEIASLYISSSRPRPPTWAGPRQGSMAATESHDRRVGRLLAQGFFGKLLTTYLDDFAFNLRALSIT